MSESPKSWKPTRKHFLNLILFLSSIAIISILMPHYGKPSLYETSGRLLLVSSCYLVLFLFLLHFRAEILEVTRKTFFIILTVFFFTGLTSVVYSYFGTRALFIIPFAIIPVIIHTFYDARLALFILLITLMLAGFIVPDPFEFVFMNFISGVIAIFSLTNIYRKGKIFFASLVVTISYSVLFTGINLAANGDNAIMRLSDFRYFIMNGFLVLLSYPLIFLFERRFYFLSNTTLLELTDTSQPLLRRFAHDAPGSFHHARQVSVLAEEAAREVGANLLLVRAGALYHDIGKIINSEYFIENQTIKSSPHDEMSPVDSSKLIINHVNEGVMLARKYKLPVQVIDFIRTHHGTTRAYYFYQKYFEAIKKSGDDEKAFEYPGPKPFSKEHAIIMMADAVEASSRTLEKYNEENISELVERILYLQEQDDQFSEAPLTFRDISDIKRTFKKGLANIYHSRIAYPGRIPEL